MTAPSKVEVRVSRNGVVAREIHLLQFERTDGKDLEFSVGQYVTFYLDREGRHLTKSYSFASGPRPHDGFDLLVKRVAGGFGSNFLCDVAPGTTLTALLPLGKFTLHDNPGRQVLFLATGTGIAPFIPMLDELHARFPGAGVTLVVGSRFEGDLIFPDRLRALERSWGNFRYYPVLSKPPEGWRGETGRIQGVVRKYFPTLENSDVYICGVPEMVGEAQALALELKAPKDRIFVERY